MKQTFLPIVILLSVTLTLVALLYFADTGNPCCKEAPPAKRVRTGIICSSLELVDTTTPMHSASKWSVALLSCQQAHC